jgi:hypothetical protein
MGQADEIREYVKKAYIERARRRGATTVTVRTGDVHRALELVNRMPAVCSALEAAKFQEYAGVRLIGREGPRQGANVRLTFEV